MVGQGCDNGLMGFMPFFFLDCLSDVGLFV
jgi:hypothetical protein